MRVFLTAPFRRFMKEHRLGKPAVCSVVREVSSGLIHANLGSGLFKQRVARPGQGKSGGLRTILILKTDLSAFFILGFAKNDRDNLYPKELAVLKDLAKEMLGYDQKTIDLAIQNGALEEIVC